MHKKNNNRRIDAIRKCLPYAGFAAVLLSVAPMSQANWRVSPELAIGVEYDDNTRLNNVPGLSNADTGYGASVAATFFYNTALTQFYLTPRLRFRGYSDDSDLDSNDQFVRFNWRHDRQRSNFRMRGDFSSESVRTAERNDVEFDLEDSDEVPIDDTGRTLDTGKRERFRIRPSFSYDVTQKVTFGLEGSVTDTSYGSDVSTALAGFSDYSVGALLGLNLSPQDTITLRGFSGKYEVSGEDVDSSRSGFDVAYSRQMSERTRFRLSLGGDTSEDVDGDDETNPVGEISVIHNYETTRILASYRRVIAGSGSGGLSVRDAISLNVSRDVSPRLTLGGGVRAYRTDALDSSNTAFVERDYLQIRALARWALTRKLSIEFDYRFTDIDRNLPVSSVTNGDSNLFSLWLNWHPNPLP